MMKLFCKKEKREKKIDYSKKLITDIRSLLWAVTIGGIILAFYCIYKGYMGSIPWITAMVGLPWSAHGTVCAFYLNMAKSDHRGADGTGITFAAAQANDFVEPCDEEDWNSPEI